MTAPMSREPKRLEVTLSVSTEDQAEELNAAWHEILSGKRLRLTTAAQDLDEIMERARAHCRRSSRRLRRIPGRDNPGVW
jgi:hypothetical protein